MTLTQAPITTKLSDGMRRIIAKLNQQPVDPKTGLVHVLTEEIIYPEGIGQSTPALWGFRFDGHHGMRVEVYFHPGSQTFHLIGSGWRADQYLPVREMTRATAPDGWDGLTIDHYNEYLRRQPPQMDWSPDPEVRKYHASGRLPDGLKAAIMRGLGLTT